jgi:hypothetical protein
LAKKRAEKALRMQGLTYRAAHNERVRVPNAAYQKRAAADPSRWASRAIIRLRHIAKQKNIPFDLAPEDLHIPAACPALGAPFVFGAGYRDEAGPSVDRIIPALGYVRGNVVVISLRANRLKHDVTNSDDLRKIADYIDKVTK